MLPMHKTYFRDTERSSSIEGTIRHYREGDRILATRNYLYPFIEWSAGYAATDGKKLLGSPFRKYYNFNDYFSYRGSNYLVYENFPFEDFNMIPIRWTLKQSQKYTGP